MAFLVVGKIQIVNDIDDLTKKNAVFHVLVCIFKGGLHDGLFDRRIRRYLDAFNQDLAVGVLDVVSLQHREQRVIDEVQQRIACHGAAGFIVMCPVCPAALFRYDRHIVLVIKLPILLLGVIYFQKQHPCDLLDALGVTVDARVIAHDVTKSFYKSG